MKHYRVLSKVILAICLCGIILAIINGFTRIINSSIQISGTVICICWLSYCRGCNYAVRKCKSKERIK